MSPFMVVSVVLSVTFPLVFVAGLGRKLPLVGIVVLAAQIPLALVAQRVAGLWGLALALAIDRVRGRLALHLLKALEETVRGLAGAVGAVFLVFLLAFVPAAFLGNAIAAAALGLVLGRARRRRPAAGARSGVALPPGALTSRVTAVVLVERHGGDPRLHSGRSRRRPTALSAVVVDNGSTDDVAAAVAAAFQASA